MVEGGTAMNKQELIDKWENKTGAPTFETRGVTEHASNDDMYTFGYGVARKEILEDLKQLDEPQKPVVPKFVADWISFCKNKNKDLSYAMHDNFLRNFLLERFGDNDNRVRWLTDYKNQEIFARACLDGYEVEKVPKYIVKIGKLYLKEPLGDTSNSTILTTWDKKCAYPFSSFHMADKHADKFEGTVEEVVEG